MVYKESDINTLACGHGHFKNKIKELKPKYPAIQFTTTRDSSEEIQLMFRVLGSSFIFGALFNRRHFGMDDGTADCNAGLVGDSV